MSDNLLAYLKCELNRSEISSDIPLTRLLGGYETFTYHFKLQGAQQGFSKHLVLRLFREPRGPDQAVWESVVQNVLASQGYPAPSVYLACTDKTQLGGVFIIMEFLPGETMWEAAFEESSVLLGTAHAGLHDLPMAPLVDALQEHGFDEHRYRISGRYVWLKDKSETFPWLEGCVQWLIENRPPEPERLSVCHLDFHPFNVLIEDGQVTGVVDWPGFSIGDPAMDVASTIFLINFGAGQVLQVENANEVISQYIEAYLEAYRSVRPLDAEHIDYYRVMKAVNAFISGADGQEIWTSPGASKFLTELVHDIAGVSIDLPSN